MSGHNDKTYSAIRREMVGFVTAGNEAAVADLLIMLATVIQDRGFELEDRGALHRGQLWGEAAKQVDDLRGTMRMLWRTREHCGS